MTKRALVVGIDDYPNAPLAGCVNDATAMGKLLLKNGDGSPNFAVRTLTSDKQNVDAPLLQEEIEKLFRGEADTVLLYFAGHGTLNTESSAGDLVSQDGRRGAWGFSFAELLQLANTAYPRIRSTVIITDCCQSGAIGELPLAGNPNVAALGTGVTLLTACERDQLAVEYDGHGLFTSILIRSLEGASADLGGRITPASIYADVDQALGAYDQRPLYKANVRSFVCLRSVNPKIPLKTIRRLNKIFKTADDQLQLDPEHEPERGEEAERLKDIPVVPEKVELYRELQACNRHGLVVPVEWDHMWHTAVHSGHVRLTDLGKHYRRLAEGLLI